MVPILLTQQISNNIGVDLSKVIQLQVQQPPKVATKFSTETVTKGSTASLQCRSEGDPILSAEWKRDMQNINSNKNQRYIVKEDNSRNNIISYLEILDTGRLDSALFTCTISNNYGTDICNIQLIVQGLSPLCLPSIFMYVCQCLWLGFGYWPIQRNNTTR